VKTEKVGIAAELFFVVGVAPIIIPLFIGAFVGGPAGGIPAAGGSRIPIGAISIASGSSEGAGVDGADAILTAKAVGGGGGAFAAEISAGSSKPSHSTGTASESIQAFLAGGGQNGV